MFEFTQHTRSLNEDSPISQNESLREEIRHRAYQIYADRGEAHGDDVTDWLTARQEVLLKYALLGRWSSSRLRLN